MRLISATVRNYRIHRELTVTFGKSLNLVGGPNESGKSTLVEAIHRALFMKAKGTSEDHRATRSDVYSGHPEVDLTFEAGGTTYRLVKRFAGASGTTSLTGTDGKPLHDAEAEAALTKILGVQPATGGSMLTQWAHLWVEQGSSGRNPSGGTTAQKDRLLQRLQDIGAAAVLQSEFDAQIAERFSALCRELFTNQAAPRAGSELFKATSAAQDAQLKLTNAGTRVRLLHETSDRLRSTLEELAETRESRTRLKEQNDALAVRERELNQLRHIELQYNIQAESAAAALLAATEAELSTASSIALVQSLEESIAPAANDVLRYEEALFEAKQKLANAEDAHGRATNAAREARRRRDLAAALVDRFSASEALVAVEARIVESREIRAVIAAREAQRAELPLVDKKKQKALQSARELALTTRATLEAMSTSLVVRSADASVRLADEVLGVGDARVLTDGAEVSVGEGVCLFIQPGGGINLAEARHAADEAQFALDGLLAQLGVASVDAAVLAFQRRTEIGAEIETMEARLEDLEAGDLDDQLLKATTEAQAADAEVLARSSGMIATDLPVDLSAAKSVARSEKQAVKDAEAIEVLAKDDRDARIEELGAVDSALADAKSTVKVQKLDLDAARAQRDFLVQQHGDRPARNRRRHDAERANETSQQLLISTRAAIAVLNPSELDSDTKRLERALDANTEHHSALQVSAEQARTILRSDGSLDPHADFAGAEAHALSTAEERDRVQRRAQAIRLLDSLFSTEQRELGRLLTQPLVEKINSYLQPVFGAGSAIGIEYNGSEFTGLSLRRGAASQSLHGFDALSGGAKEQAACAVRLATAELLAQDHDGCLPVVLDDAFAYSDAKRVNGVHRMLDLAASRGLQVIVLSCNPSDYEALGAKSVRLSAADIGQLHSLLAAGESLPGADYDVGVDDPEDAIQVVVAPPSTPSFEDRSEIFLLLLRSRGGHSGNLALRNELGWNEEVYGTVRMDLIAARRIVPGKGRGGTVTIVEQSERI